MAQSSAMHRARYLAWALALVLGGTTAAGADSRAKVDRSQPNLQPEYPDTAQVAGEQGDVVVAVKVSASGRVWRVDVDRSSGFTDLDNAAVETAYNWHYTPAITNGDTASGWVKVKFHYQLPQAAQLPAPAANPAPH